MKPMVMTGKPKRNQMNKIACVTGITGMDGANLAKVLLEDGYRVIGIKRRSSVDNLWRLKVLNILDKIELVEGDITDTFSLYKIWDKYGPDFVYNLAAQSHVGTSFSQPKLTFDITCQGAINIADTFFDVNSKGRMYQASSSECFGSNFVITDGIKVQDETTKMDGNSPYGIAKTAAHNYMRVLREGHGRFISCGILFNHTGELRGSNFLERKVTKWIGDANAYQIENKDRYPKLKLGDLSTYRDMGYSLDYVVAMKMMLEDSTPDDYVVCTGVSYMIEDIVRMAFEHVGLDWKEFVEIDSNLIRPREVEYLRGNNAKIVKKLGWTPTLATKGIINRMVDADILWSLGCKNYG